MRGDDREYRYAPVDMQRYTAGLQGVGKTISLTTITREGVRRDAIPGAASAPGLHEIGCMDLNEVTTTADGKGPSRYTVTAPEAGGQS